MDTEEKKITSSEIDEMLKEAAAFHQPVRKSNNNRKKRAKIRYDMIIAGIVAIVLIAGIAALIVHFAKKSDGNSAKSTTDNPLMEEKYPEISDVVKNYLNAYLIEDSQKRLSILAQYVDNMGAANEADISQNKYISKYSEVECYTKEGPYENTYVVYAYYHMEFKNISTSVPGIATLYVIRDSKTGNVYIHNGLSSDIEKYVKDVSKNQDVKDLLADVDKEFKSTVDSDERLKAFFGKLDKTTESTTTKASGTTTSGGATQQAATQPAATQQVTDKK